MHGIDIAPQQRQFGCMVLAATRARCVPIDAQPCRTRAIRRVRRRGVIDLEERLAIGAARQGEHVRGRDVSDRKRARERAALAARARLVALSRVRPRHREAGRRDKAGRSRLARNADMDRGLADGLHGGQRQGEGRAGIDRCGEFEADRAALARHDREDLRRERVVARHLGKAGIHAAPRRARIDGLRVMAAFQHAVDHLVADVERVACDHRARRQVEGEIAFQSTTAAVGEVRGDDRVRRVALDRHVEVQIGDGERLGLLVRVVVAVSDMRRELRVLVHGLRRIARRMGFGRAGALQRRNRSAGGERDGECGEAFHEIPLLNASACHRERGACMAARAANPPRCAGPRHGNSTR